MSAEFDFNAKPNTDFDTAPLRFSDAPATDGDEERMWELLSLYADGEAAPDEAAQVEQMLRHDAEYARAFAFLRQSGNAVRAIVEVEPPAHLRSAILAKTTQRVTVGRRLMLAWDALRGQFVAPVGRLSLAGGGLAACALLVGLYVGHSAPQQAGSANDAGRPTIAAMTRPAPVLPFRYELPNPIDYAPAQADAASAVTATRRGIGKELAVDTPSAVAANALSPKAGSHAAPPNVTAPTTTAPAAIAKAAPVPNAGLSAAAAKKPVLLAAGFAAKNGKQIALLNPRHKHPVVPDAGSDDMRATQNLYPMMDTRVQHRTASMPTGGDGMTSDGDNLDDGTFVTSHDSSPAAATADTPDDNSAPGEGHRIVGKLQLAKLPPSARRLLTPSEVVHQANAAALRYSAAATDVTPRREADVPMMTLHY